MYDKASDWIFSTGPRILFGALVLIFGIWVIRIARKKISGHFQRKKIHSSLRPFFESLVFTTLHVVLALLVMGILGIKLTMFAAIIAAFGAAAGLALSGTLQNFASGVLILLLKPFKTSDNIVAQGFEGTVDTIQIFYTVVNTFDNRTVIIPNSKLSNEVIVNITRRGIRRLDIELKFKYTEDIDKLKEVLRQAFIDFPEVENDPAPRIGITAIDTDSFTLRCNVWLHAHGFEDTRMVVNEKIIATLKAAGIIAKA
jgi:small conductance mechanosensitive channel